MKKESETELLTVAEVAALFRVSVMTIYRLVNSGKIRAYRVGRSYRIPRKEAESYLEWTAQG